MTVTVVLPEDLSIELEKLAQEDRIAPDELLADLLRKHLALRRIQQIRAELVPLAQAQGIYTDEDVFEIIS